jgi:hypothetical protein
MLLVTMYIFPTDGELIANIVGVIFLGHRFSVKWKLKGSQKSIMLKMNFGELSGEERTDRSANLAPRSGGVTNLWLQP